MSLKNFILSKLFLKQLGIAFIIITGLTILMLLSLNIYTRHGQAVPVPDFVGQNMESVKTIAKKSKMRYQVIDSVYTTHVPRGCVAEQNPKPGFRVKKWRNIALTINAFKPEMVAMPDLVDLPLRQAIALIEGSGLVLGTLKYKPDLSRNIVLNQLYNGREIVGNDSIQKGSVIDLVLGKGLSNQRTSVPNLLGMTLESATETIFRASLNLGTYIFDKTIRTKQDSLNAFVYKQNPEFRDDASLQLGSSIYLWMTTDSLKLQSDSTSMVLSESSLNACLLRQKSN